MITGRKLDILQNNNNKTIYDYHNTKDNIKSDLLNFEIIFLKVEYPIFYCSSFIKYGFGQIDISREVCINFLPQNCLFANVKCHICYFLTFFKSFFFSEMELYLNLCKL